MESFHIPSSSLSQSCQKSYEFSPETLADIPCPDECFTQTEGSALEDDVELPLPPGTSGDDFLMPLSSKQQFLSNSINIFPFLPQNKASKSPTSNLDHISVPENLNSLPLQYDIKPKSGFKAKEFQEDVLDKPAEFMDDNKYSPSKVDSDEENQDFVTPKPKVLGKEQAKKRLMAFSLSKQPSVSIKKQSKAVASAKNKEKPPNPNKGSNVQEQFRATISAIEEEKKKMFQNMPSYLLLEMSELAKSSHTSMSSSLQLLEKLKKENADSKNKNYSKNGSSLNEKNKSKKSFRKSRSRSHSRSKNKKRKRSRSRSRTKRSHSRKRKRNHSRSCRSTSRNRRSKEEHNFKTDKILRENQTISTKKLTENWSSFKSSGFVLESESELSKNSFSDSKLRRYEYSKRSRSPNKRAEFKPIFNYLSKSCRPMVSLQAKPADSGNSFSVAFSEKTIKYTRTKPTLCWAENPSHATEYYMSKQMLLENCDESTCTLLLPIIENKRVFPLEKEESMEGRITKNRPWYPHESYFLSDLSKTYENLEFETHVLKKSVDLDNKVGEQSLSETVENKKEINSNDDGKRIGKASPERKISLVNDSYLSDEEDQVKEMIVGDVKVQLDLDMNSVKVRSKWDSDYEGENSEKELNSTKEKKITTKLKTEESPSESKEKLMDSYAVAVSQPIRQDSSEKKKSSFLNLSSLNLPYAESPNLDVSNGTTGNLVSEYEEFLKMVSVESSDLHNFQKIETPSETKTDIQKVKEVEKSSEENQEVRTPKFAPSEWDQESDHEEKLNSKKMRFTGPNDEFLIHRKNEKLDVKLEKEKKKPPKKKNEKFKSMKKKLLKNLSKEKKKKFEESYSEESTSESYESDSGSDSDENLSKKKKKKKKKKKISKIKKKNKKDSSSDSSSDSDESKRKKKKSKSKKGGKKKSSSSDDSDGEAQNTLLKQLDFKKQLIMKKIEEIDSISVRTIKKKEKNNRAKKKEKESSDDMDSEKHKKSEKKKTPGKVDKKKFKVVGKKSKILENNKKLKKSKSSSESESESSEKSVKKKKAKKEKRKRDSSNSSDSEEKPAKLKSKSLDMDFKRISKSKKDSSSSSSDDSINTSKDRKNVKIKGSKVKSDDEKPNKITEPNLKESLLFEDSNTKSELPSEWENKKLWKKPEAKIEKEEDDWETSSSVEASEQEGKPRESSWDEEVDVREPKVQVSEDSLATVDKGKMTTITDKEFSENNLTSMSDTNNQIASETLKTSFSNFSFNENSFCSFGQELSRDFFLAERCYSNSENITSDENLRTTTIEARPFQSVNKDSEVKKPADSELYSPGYSDSELSDTEIYETEKMNSNCTAENEMKKDVYDPLNCDSEGSVENKDVELSSIPLPCVSNILLPGEPKHFENIGVISSSIPKGSVLKNAAQNESIISVPKMSSIMSPAKSSFTSVDFVPVATARFSLNDGKITPTKRQVMSVKGQQKLISKAASVFQDESDEENLEPLNKAEVVETIQSDISERLKEKIPDENESRNAMKERYAIEGNENCRKNSRDRSRERSNEGEKRRRSRSRERRSNSKFLSKKAASPNRRKKSKTPEVSREKREIRSDSFEIEPLKSSIGSNEMTDVVQPIPVLMGVDTSSTEALWSRSFVSGCEFSHGTDILIDHAESFDIYPPGESKYRNRNYDKDYEDHERIPAEKSRDGRSKKERRKSRSRSYSPRKKIRSRSPERRKRSRSRSPRRKSISPKHSNKSSFSPKRRSPKRKSPSRRYKSSRSPDHRRRSSSRSPRRSRSSPSRLSRSLSPRTYWSPKRREESPRRKDSPLKSFSPEDRFSPQKNFQYSESYASGLQNRIPVIGASNEGVEMKLSPSAVHSSFDDPLSFHRQMPDSSITESDMYNSFYESHYPNEFGVSGYSEEVGVNNLITLKSHEIEKENSPERLSLDQRIELELCASMTGSQVQNDQYQMQTQVCPSFQEINSTHFQNSYNCENTSLSNDNYYHNQNLQINPDYNDQYFNRHQQQPSPNYGSFQQYSNSQPVQNSVLQVGNIVEVVPTLQHPPPPPPPLPSKVSQIMQVGNVLQVVPSPKATPTSHNYGLPDISPIVKTQKATAVVAPSSIVPTPNPEAVLNPLIKAIQLEREKRKKEKEKRKAEREARRKARQQRREAKLMSVNEKLKKSVQNEGLMLGQEVEDDELLDGLDVPSPPIPVEIITFSSPSALPPAGKGILITAGFMPKPPSEKKEVKFADGICPGEGTSTSGGEDVASPPPKPKLPKEKRFKKKKTKVKKKVKVQIIRQIIQEEDDDEDDLSPPPPPPGDPPPVFFAKYPFGGDAQFPVYQTQTTTTTTLTTVQYPAQAFE